MEKENDKIDLGRYINALKKKWYWGVAFFVVVMGLAVTYAVIKMPQFESYSMLLIEDNSDSGGQSLRGGMAGMMRAFSIGGFGKTSADNELLILKSHATKKTLSKRLALNRTYVERSGLCKTFLYKNSPIMVDAPEQLFDTLQAAFKISVKIKGDKVDLSASKGRLGKTLASKKDVELPCVFETPYGNFQILKTSFYDNNKTTTIDVNIAGDDIIATSLDEDVLSVDFRNKKADVLELIILDVSKERGCDILNTLMAIYNERRNERRNETATVEVAFLNDRIADLGAQLMESEQKVTSFKKDNNLIDLGVEATYLLEQDKTAGLTTVKMDVEKTLLEEVLNQLKDPSKKYTLIPMAETLGDGGAVSVITNYNELVMRRMRVSKSAKEDNVVLKSINDQIDALHTAAIENVERALDNLRVKYASVVREQNKQKGKLTSLPEYEQEYIDLKRDREMKNALYVFLLEKRESALLKQNNAQELGFVIEPAYSAIKPYMKKIIIILVAGGVVGLLGGLILSLILGLRKRVSISKDAE